MGYDSVRRLAVSILGLSTQKIIHTYNNLSGALTV